MNLNELPVENAIFDVRADTLIAPNGGDLVLTLYEPCRHSRWRRIWDVLRHGEHSPEHPFFRAVAPAVTGDVRPLSEIDLEGSFVGDDETITVKWDSYGRMKLL